MDRRTFLAATSAMLTTAEGAPPIPVIDCHIHLFDIHRPQGVPWPPKEETVLYKTALPDRFRKIADPFGVVGASEIEASPWADDPQWVLDVAAKDPIIVGTVGNLEPDRPEFPRALERLHKNPLFRGIRYGNLWDRDFTSNIAKPETIAGLRLVAEADLVMDSANPDTKLIRDLVRLTDKIPSLRIVVDHLPRLEKPSDAAALKSYQQDLRELGKRPQVYCKVSGVVRRVNGKVPEEPAFYNSAIDEMWDVFGGDRLLYGSDWPNSDLWAEYPVEFRVVKAYFDRKGRAAAENYFWKNSVRAYKWIRRDPAQPGV
jgi:predicted TIM-barrel fold metal-dependent hydrolase